MSALRIVQVDGSLRPPLALTSACVTSASRSSAVGIELERVKVIVVAGERGLQNIDPHLLAGGVVAGVEAAVAIVDAQVERGAGGKLGSRHAGDDDHWLAAA